MAIPGNFLSPTTEAVDPNTSGWTTKLNCTIGLGSGGRNGDGVLRLTSIASGEMQARTVSSYPVTPFAEYEAFADASGATVPERIGIRWLNSSGTEISITWSMTTATASATWHRIAVGGKAPATAAYAQVVVSATPAGSGVINYFENVFFGFPIRYNGNLLSWNAENTELDAAAWTSDANCTISRQAPMVSWPVNWYLGGGHVAAMTATANGNAAMRVVERPAATPGVEYMAFAYLNPPSAGAVVWIELRFYDAADTQIQATRAVLAQPGTGWYRQIVSAVAPAGTASASMAVGVDSATAGQVLRADAAVVATVSGINNGGVLTPLQAGSVLPYADASFEQGVAGWTVVSGVATLARSTPWGFEFTHNSYSLTVSSSTATASTIRSAKFPVGDAGGQSWSASLNTKVTSGGWTIQRGIRWYDAANTDLGLTSVATSAVPTPNWWNLTVNVTAPAGATQAALEWILTATSASSVLRVDKVTLWQALPLSSVTKFDNDAYIQVTVRELDTADTITVWRVLPDGARTLVRGTTGLISGATLTTDQLVVEDYEAPLGVPVYYYAETRSSAGALTGSRTTVTVTLDTPGDDYGWLKDPANPQRNLKVLIARAPDWDRPIEQAEYRIRGRRNSVIFSDVRGGLQGDLTVWTQSDSERAQLHWLLDSGNTLLWQATPGLGVADMYVNVGQIAEARAASLASDTWRAWTLPFVEADLPTAVGVNGSGGRTWQDVLTEFATWADVQNAFATWEDVLFNRRIT